MIGIEVGKTSDDEELKAENYKDAIDAYSEALKLNPENKEALLKKGLRRIKNYLNLMWIRVRI